MGALLLARQKLIGSPIPVIVSGNSEEIMARGKPGRKPEGLGAAFSCRLRKDQDSALRKEASSQGLPLVAVLRRWVDRALTKEPARG